MPWMTRRMESWGRLQPVDMQVDSPGNLAEAAAAWRAAPAAGLIAYGAGRSYGDQPLLSQGAAVHTARLDCVESFDPVTGDLVAESGVSLQQLVRQFLPQGYMPPVSPGTAFVTLGGCIAKDIHGKNHESQGSFGQHVQWFDLLLPSGELRRVGPADKALFTATMGGMGLTGLILRVCLRLRPVRSNAVDLREERIAELDAFIERFEMVRTRQHTRSAGSMRWPPASGWGAASSKPRSPATWTWRRNHRHACPCAGTCPASR